jgi:hypothetical protein
VTRPSIFLKSRSIPHKKARRDSIAAGILSKIRLESLEVRPRTEGMAVVMMTPGDGHCCHRRNYISRSPSRAPNIFLLLPGRRRDS